MFYFRNISWHKIHVKPILRNFLKKVLAFFNDGIESQTVGFTAEARTKNLSRASACYRVILDLFQKNKLSE